MTEQQIDRERLRKLAAWSAKLYEQTGSAPGMAVEVAEAVPQLLDQLDQQERELDYWMARAYEAEGKLWKAEAIIRRQEQYIEGLESTDAVGLKARAEKAEADRDWNLRSSRLAKEERIKANARADQAEARIKAVLDLCDAEEDPDQWPPRPVMHGGEPFPASLDVTDIRRALEG